MEWLTMEWLTEENVRTGLEILGTILTIALGIKAKNYGGVVKAIIKGVEAYSQIEETTPNSNVKKEIRHQAEKSGVGKKLEAIVKKVT